MRKLTLFALAFFVLALIPASSTAAVKKTSSDALKAYLKALETFKFKQAYNYVSPAEKKSKKLNAFTQEHPVVFLKAMQLDNKEFFQFKVQEGTDENEITVNTVDLVFPDPDLNYQFMYMIAKQGMKKNKSLKPNNPQHVLQAFKEMLKEDGMTELPFKQVEKKFQMEKIKGKWYVNPGWKEAALKKEQARKEREKEMKKQAATRKIDSIVRQAKMMPSDFNEELKKLEKIKKEFPDVTEVDEAMILMKKFQDNFKKIAIKALEPKATPISKIINIEIKNNSEMTLNHFIVEYSLLDDKGKVLKKEEFQFNSSNLEPSEPDGCKPGYTGQTTMGFSVRDTEAYVKNWAKTEVRLKAVSYFVE
ncbi:MAG: hypothetical protein JW827_06450 [Spirochaetes bacterium]|nr:hypothetical protein [Spirochaetota bacterium]